MRVCASAGCPQLLPRGTTYCEAHARKREPGPPGTTRYLNDPRWRNFRAKVIRERPLCECGCRKPSTDVHHLDELGLDGPLAYDRSNVEALAHGCHSSITVRGIRTPVR